MKALLEQWGTEFGTARVYPLVDGIWRLQLDGTSYILKRRTNRTRTLEEYDLLKWLLEQGQPISLLLLTTNNVPWAEERGLFYVLYPFLDGIAGDELNLIEPSLAEGTGMALASLHLGLASYGSRLDFPVFNLFQEVSAYAWSVVQGYSSQQFSDRLQALERAISTELVNRYETLPRQLIHRDFHPGNLLFRNRQLAGILDFDRVRIGIRLFDLCYLATAVLSGNFRDPQIEQKWSVFVQSLLQGYQSGSSLEQTEYHSFLYIIYLIQLTFIAYYLDEGNRELADLNLEMLFWIYDRHDRLDSLIKEKMQGTSGEVI